MNSNDSAFWIHYLYLPQYCDDLNRAVNSNIFIKKIVYASVLYLIVQSDTSLNRNKREHRKTLFRVPVSLGHNQDKFTLKGKGS